MVWDFELDNSICRLRKDVGPYSAVVDKATAKKHWYGPRGCGFATPCKSWCLLKPFEQEDPGGHLKNCPGNICKQAPPPPTSPPPSQPTTTAPLPTTTTAATATVAAAPTCAATVVTNGPGEKVEDCDNAYTRFTAPSDGTLVGWAATFSGSPNNDNLIQVRTPEVDEPNKLGAWVFHLFGFVGVSPRTEGAHAPRTEGAHVCVAHRTRG